MIHPVNVNRLEKHLALNIVHNLIAVFLTLGLDNLNGAVVKQFNNIVILPAKDDQPALMADGALSLGENIADQGGLRVAYTALQNSFKTAGVPEPIDGFTAAQRFYLSYATIWGQNIRDEEAARLTKVDVHSLGKNRVNATLRNIATFYEAFDIKDGAMFLDSSVIANPDDKLWETII